METALTMALLHSEMNNSLKSMSIKEKVKALFKEQRNYGKLVKISSTTANLVRLITSQLVHASLF